jgi:hypothetical protein
MNHFCAGTLLILPPCDADPDFTTRLTTAFQRLGPKFEHVGLSHGLPDDVMSLRVQHTPAEEDGQASKDMREELASLAVAHSVHHQMLGEA